MRGNSAAAKAIFQHATQAAKLHHIDLDIVARQSFVSRNELVNKLNDWDQDNVIDLKVSGMQHVYKVEKQLPATAHERLVIADQLFAQMHKREQQDLQRTKDVINLVTARSCISRGLAKYFGDDTSSLSAECGHCSWCETHSPITLAERQIIKEDRGAVGKILNAVPERDDPRFLSRIAFGIKSPRITALKYSNLAIFGSLKEHDFLVRFV